MHCTVNIDNGQKSKPETVKCYNYTKFGVDVVNQISRKYTVNAVSRRWPVQFFYNVLDLAAINAHILFMLDTTSKLSYQRFFCGYPKSFVRDLLTKEKLAHINPIALTAGCRKTIKESTAIAKTAPTKHVKHAAHALSLFVVNAVENKKKLLL